MKSLDRDKKSGYHSLGKKKERSSKGDEGEAERERWRWGVWRRGEGGEELRTKT